MEVIPAYDTPLPYLLIFPFFVAFIALHYLVFKPILAYLDQREGYSSGAREAAAQLDSEVDQRLAEIRDRLEGARSEGRALRADSRARVLEEEQRILAAARRASEARVDEALQRIEREKEEASVALRAMTATLSQDIAGQVLGRPLDA